MAFVGLTLSPSPKLQPSRLVFSETRVQEAHLVWPLGFTDKESETWKEEVQTQGSLVTVPILEPKTSEFQARDFLHSPYRLWPGSSKSPKPLTPKAVVPGSEVTHCLASQGTPSLSVTEGLAGVPVQRARSRERPPPPQGTWAWVTQGPKSPSWRDLEPKVKGHRQGRAGKHRGSRGQR